jgi:hypothetical protein
MKTEELYKVLISIHPYIEESFPFSIIIRELQGDPDTKYGVTTISSFNDSRFSCGISNDLEFTDDPSYDECNIGRIWTYSSREIHDLYQKLNQIRILYGPRNHADIQLGLDVLSNSH